jgi:hypothetical protein
LSRLVCRRWRWQLARSLDRNQPNQRRGAKYSRASDPRTTDSS